MNSQVTDPGPIPINSATNNVVAELIGMGSRVCHKAVHMFKYVYNRRDTENNSPTADDVVVAVRAEQTSRPRRKATKRAVNLFVDENGDPEPEYEYDSDAENDHEFTEQDALNEADDGSCEEAEDGDDDPPAVTSSKPSNKKKKGETMKPLPYNPPEGIAEICQEYQERRVEDMIEELQSFDPETAEFEWSPNEDDIEDIERTVLSRWVIFLQ